MGLGVLGVFLGLLLEVSSQGPHNGPRTTWKPHAAKQATDSPVLSAAREAIFELKPSGTVTARHQTSRWQTLCWEGRAGGTAGGQCPFDPSQSFTTVMVDGELYSGTAYNFLGSEPIISRYSPLQSLLRTEYSTSWLNEPSFVFADVIREGGSSRLDGEGDKIYYFFTEVSVEYEFFGKLLIPRVARVCKGDLGGQRTLQKKWTSFLKAKLVCSMPELNFVFNVGARRLRAGGGGTGAKPR
ncbi:hypothetical protein CRUP_008223 [Coryphaenoides rupestris]|nr:hypothetical protein CRUP_008223 [Coryphaenoides rupestris]